MANVPINMVIRNYDHISPLVSGDVKPEGIDLSLDRTTPISGFRENESFQAGEMSFAGYVRGLAAGDRSITGLPVFVFRGFRQRCFFVRRDAGTASLKELSGKRIGTNGWPDSGNTWSRALLRAEGVELGSIDWWVGTIDGVTDQKFGHHISVPSGISNVHTVPESKTLEDMLLADELDALMVPWPPKSLYEPDGPVIRLLRDYRRSEQAFAREAGFWPAHHLIGVRSELIMDKSELAISLFNAFEQSRKTTEERRWMNADTTPWLLNDLEDVTEVLGENWQANGVEQNWNMIRTFCSELHAQGIIDQPVDPDTIFIEFEQLMA